MTVSYSTNTQREDLLIAIERLTAENEIGKQMCGRLMAELGEKNDQIVQLRQDLARYKEREKTMGWNQK